MAHPITIPRLGWSMEEGVFAEWLKAPGEFVQAGEMVFLLEGEKAAHEIESFDSGFLCVPDDAPRPGSTVKVGDVIGYLIAEDEVAPTTVGPRTRDQPTLATAPPTGKPAAGPSTPPVAAQSRAGGKGRPAGPAARRLARELGIDLATVQTPDPTGRVLTEDIRRAVDDRRASGDDGRVNLRRVATPRARRRARELGIDWSRIEGTGRNGRVRERDVIDFDVHQASPPTSLPAAPSPTEPGSATRASKLRQVIAERMMAGVQQAAPVTIHTKVDATALVTFRADLKRRLVAVDAKEANLPSFNDILIFCVAQSLRELPQLNGCWHRDSIYIYDCVHIASAVDTPNGLLAPVIRDADKLALEEIAAASRKLAEQARGEQLSQNQLTGGTFTVTNLGMLGVDTFTPILNLPQAGILGIGRIVTEPVVREGRIEVGHTLSLSLTFDHRVVDGAPAARWLQSLCNRISALTCSP